jgi:hypothetical protein
MRGLRCRCRDPCDTESDDYDEHEGIYLGIIWICRCCVCFTVGSLALVALMIAGLVDSTLFPREAVIAFGVVGFVVLLSVVVAVLCNNPENWPWSVCMSPVGCLYFFTGSCCCCIECNWVEQDRETKPAPLETFRSETHVVNNPEPKLEIIKSSPSPSPSSSKLNDSHEIAKESSGRKKRTKRRHREKRKRSAE